MLANLLPNKLKIAKAKEVVLAPTEGLLLPGSSEVLVGTGGWAYFKAAGMDPLSAYALAFDFVEVNSTFYGWPSVNLVSSWRRRTPEVFEFALRCHRSITHRNFPIVDEAVTKALRRTALIYKTLRASLLVLETPASLDVNALGLGRLENFFKLCGELGMKLAWEIRSPHPLPRDLIKLMEEHDVAHCVDISKGEPSANTSMLYSRVFGKGERNLYQFTDEELKEISKKAERAGKSMVCFHGVRMYTDAARFKAYRQTGTFPKVTKSVGLGSAKEVLMEEGVSFPCTRGELLKRYGWRVFDLTEGRRAHLSDVLALLPDEKYNSLNQLVEGLSKALAQLR